MTTIGIIGCGGFIGSHLVERLLAVSDCRIVGLDRVSDKIAHCLSNARLRFVRADVGDEGVVRECVEASDTVISLAAICNPSLYNTTPVDVIEMNFTHPVAVARACAESGKRLIHFSTCEVYGRTIESYGIERESEESAALNETRTPLVLGPVPVQRWSYACAKQLAERMIFALGVQHGLEYTIVRPFNFIGPRMDYIPGVDGEGIPRVIACFMEALMRDQPLKLVDGGQARRTFTYIDDAVDAVIAMIDKRAVSQGKTFNVGNAANETTIAELASSMIRLFEHMRPESKGAHRVEHVSGMAFYGEGYEDSDRRIPDTKAARDALGWRATVGLEETLQRTIAWYLESYEGRLITRAAV